MIRRPPRSTRTDTLFPYTTLFRSAHVAHPAAHCPDRMFARSGGMCAGFTEFQRTVETAPVIFPIVRRPFQHLEVVVGIGTAGLGPVAPALAVAVIITVVPVSRALLIGEAEDGIGDDPVPRSEERRVGKECVCPCRSR